MDVSSRLSSLVLREESWQAEVPQAAEAPGSTEMQAQVLELAPSW